MQAVIAVMKCCYTGKTSSIYTVDVAMAAVANHCLPSSVSIEKPSPTLVYTVPSDPSVCMYGDDRLTLSPPQKSQKTSIFCHCRLFYQPHTLYVMPIDPIRQI